MSDVTARAAMSQTKMAGMQWCAVLLSHPHWLLYADTGNCYLTYDRKTGRYHDAEYQRNQPIYDEPKRAVNR